MSATLPRMSRCRQWIRWAGLLVVALLPLTGCAAPEDVSSAKPSPREPSLAEWEPSRPIAAVEMSEAERQVLNEERLRHLAEMLRISTPPKVTAVRWIYPEDIGSVVGGCIRDAGFSVSLAADGRGFKASAGTLDQVPNLNLAWYRCSATYPTDPRASREAWTAEQQKVAYQYLTEVLIPCLKGIDANPPEPPSLAVYLADPDSWHYPDPGNARTNEIWIGACPPSPPTRALLGEG